MRFLHRPNVLIIYTDQQRWDTLGCCGQQAVPTPHLDALAGMGVRLDQCYVQNPVCAPSRASFLSGQYCSALRIGANGVQFPEDAVTLPGILRAYGYTTAQIGKLHFEPHARRDHRDPARCYGFDIMIQSDEPGCYDDAYTKWVERVAPEQLAEGMDIFEAIRQKDWILYHPYESFSTIVRFMQTAADDPQVQSIKICLYRIGKDPSIIKALMRARENGKTVSVLMELRAKFDESNNIRWSRELEKIGVHVVYGPVDLKVHSKLLQVVRLEGNRLVRYTHMSSGNYNTSTAKQYGDISFLTSNPEIGEDVGELFNALTGYFGPRMYNHLLVAPLTLKSSLIQKIEREIEVHKVSGKGYIAMKANGLIDSDIIASLYKASNAGVRVDLNIRGLCCLRPGIPGVSENIRVTSIVDRFLEHSRIYYFENGGNPEMYMGSSDMMPRNLLARVEVLFPVLDKDMMENIRENILRIHLSDNVKARELLPDGTYRLVQREEGEKKLRSQKWFIDHRGVWHGSQ